MTIDEAIKHCEEVAQENEKQFDSCPMKYEGAYANNGKTACKCAEEHRQLAEWLKDYKRLLEQKPCGKDINVPATDTISRQAVDALVDELARTISDERCFISRGRSTATIMQDILDLPSVNPQPKTGHWSRKTKVDAYDIAGVKTWGIKCQCDRCDLTTIVVEDFGYYNYCPNCGVKMIEPQESRGGE